MSTAIAPEQRAQVTRDPSRTIWREYTNSNGKKYRVGYGIPAKEDLEKAREKIAGFKDPNSPEAKATRKGKKDSIRADSDPIYIDTYWTFHDGVWYAPADQVKHKIGIDEYQLGYDHLSVLYSYQLTIKCSEAWDYTFYDQDGNHYELDVDVTWWDHDVCFNTQNGEKPIIERVKATK